MAIWTDSDPGEESWLSVITGTVLVALIVWGAVVLVGVVG